MADSDRSEYLRQMAAELGIDLTAAELPRVKMMFANLERAAGALGGLPLDDELIAGAIFRARDGNGNE